MNVIYQRMLFIHNIKGLAPNRGFVYNPRVENLFRFEKKSQQIVGINNSQKKTD